MGTQLPFFLRLVRRQLGFPAEEVQDSSWQPSWSQFTTMGLTFVTSALPSSSVHIEKHKKKLVRHYRHKLGFKESKEQKHSVAIKIEPTALNVIGTCL